MHIKLPLALTGCLLALTGTELAAAPTTLVKDGKPAATIVIADQPAAISVGKPPTVVYAAEELQRFIEKASGARLEIVPAAKAPAAGTLLLVGRSALSEKYRLALPHKWVGPEWAGDGETAMKREKKMNARAYREQAPRGDLGSAWLGLGPVANWRADIQEQVLTGDNL